MTWTSDGTQYTAFHHLYTITIRGRIDEEYAKVIKDVETL